jgi:hypothetical protein
MLSTHDLAAVERLAAKAGVSMSRLRARIEREIAQRRGHASTETRIVRETAEASPDLKRHLLDVVRDCLAMAADPGHPSLSVVAEALQDECERIVGLSGLKVPRRIRPGAVAIGSPDGNLALPALATELVGGALANIDFYEVARAWVIELVDGWIAEGNCYACGGTLDDGGRCDDCSARVRANGDVR